MASCRASAKGRDAEAGIVSDLLALSLALPADDSLAAGIGKEALLTPQQVRCSKAAHHSGWDLVEIDSKMIQQRFVLQTIGVGVFCGFCDVFLSQLVDQSEPASLVDGGTLGLNRTRLECM